MGAHPKTMGNQPAAETRTIAAPAPAETNRDEMQQAMDADVTRVGGAYDPDVDFKKNLRLRNPMLDYTKMELLGQGAFGAVYKIQDKKTKVLYAMKEIDVQRTDPATLQREMAVALGVHHEYLVKPEPTLMSALTSPCVWTVAYGSLLPVQEYSVCHPSN